MHDNVKSRDGAQSLKLPVEGLKAAKRRFGHRAGQTPGARRSLTRRKDDVRSERPEGFGHLALDAAIEIHEQRADRSAYHQRANRQGRLRALHLKRAQAQAPKDGARVSYFPVLPPYSLRNAKVAGAFRSRPSGTALPTSVMMSASASAPGKITQWMLTGEPKTALASRSASRLPSP